MKSHEIESERIVLTVNPKEKIHMRKLIARMAMALATGVLLVSGLVLAAEIPADKAEIKIDLIAGKKGAVTFHHAKPRLHQQIEFFWLGPFGFFFSFLVFPLMLGKYVFLVGPESFMA